MSKRKINFIFDAILWNIIYLFPIILTFILSIPFDGMNVPYYDIFTNVMSNMGFNSSNFMCLAIAELGSVFPTNIFDIGSFLNLYGSYFIIATLFGIVVDIIIFLPRLFHNWIGGIGV